jgi:hypothetical protein
MTLHSGALAFFIMPGVDMPSRDTSLFSPTLDTHSVIEVLYLRCRFILELSRTGSAEAGPIFERHL